MWFREGFPARTSALPEKAQDSTASDQDSGGRWPGSWARYDPAMCSWRTAQHSLLEGLDEFSETWPRSGLMRRGECYPLRMSAPRTSVSESGLWPTPVADDTGLRSRKYAQGGTPLSLAVQMIPTPTAGDAKSSGSRNTANSNAHPGVSLTDWVRQDGGRGRMWPTPTAQDAKNNGAPSQMERNTKPLNAEVGGSLNPPFVEWLMGWPLGWSDCAASGTGKFLSWRQKHSLNL